MISLEKTNADDSVWNKIKSCIQFDHLPQALLLVGPRHLNLKNAACRLIANIFCSQLSPSQHLSPCRHCQDCLWIQQGTHPDIQEITPEEGTSSIKIEQIRALQQTAFHTPQCSKHRVIIINPIDQLNINATNALLKILEEPPKHLIFILIAENGNILPTIRSRCQCIIFSAFDHANASYLDIAQHYPEQSARRQLFQKSEEIIQMLIAVLENKIDVCSAAAKWQDYLLEDLIWFLYLLTATLIRGYSLSEDFPKEEHFNTLMQQYKQPMRLFFQLDILLEYLQKLQQNIHLNQTLVIETLLLGYIEASHVHPQ